ncbi:unnamed protein product [Diabrotica balteata]|uniref:Cuticle protein n=1 Tax=Diabrotica balteata TaxID=107213 RepID=A0A9N9SVQ4_DIABA|nr:unnamed protein product [Diabrotica balteata]
MVKGAYALMDSDGTRRLVEYTADPVNGFNAVVSKQPTGRKAVIAPAAKVLTVFSAILALTSASGVVAPAPVALAAAPLAAAPVVAQVADDTFDPNPSYSFAYDVQDALTGDSKGHIESRANGIVQGQYNVAEPDGTRRIVDYTADPVNGFTALVRKTPQAVAAAPVVAAPAAPVIAARAAPLVAARAAPVVAAPAAPVVAARAAPLVAQRAAPVLAAPVLAARSAPLLAQPAPYIASAAPLVAQSAPLLARASPYFAPSAPLLAARSYGLASAPLTYAVL